MRRNEDRAELAVFKRIVELYVPYVLVRCTRYTNRRRQAQQIGTYILITTCVMVRKLGPALPLGRIVDTVVGVVGPDVVSKGEGREWWGQSEELLLADERMRRTAQALNRLKGPLREVLVLHHVCWLEPDDLAPLLQSPAGEIEATLARARRLLARRLEGLGEEDHRARGVDVQAALAQFAAGLDRDWIAEVTACALDYLRGSATGSEG
jgi:predicted RNA-binding protein YlxR (DUF448 family)